MQHPATTYHALASAETQAVLAQRRLDAIQHSETKANRSGRLMPRAARLTPVKPSRVRRLKAAGLPRTWPGNTEGVRVQVLWSDTATSAYRTALSLSRTHDAPVCICESPANAPAPWCLVVNDRPRDWSTERAYVVNDQVFVPLVKPQGLEQNRVPRWELVYRDMATGQDVSILVSGRASAQQQKRGLSDVDAVIARWRASNPNHRLVDCVEIGQDSLMDMQSFSLDQLGQLLSAEEIEEEKELAGADYNRGELVNELRGEMSVEDWEAQEAWAAGNVDYSTLDTMPLFREHCEEQG